MDEKATDLLIVLALFKVRALVSGSLRFRTACDLKVTPKEIVADQPEGFMLPAMADIEGAVRKAVSACRSALTQTTVQFNDELKKGKESDEGGDDGEKA